MKGLKQIKWQKSVQNYSCQMFKKDLIAGITLFVMLVPQGMAYALLAGLPPVMGLYASTVPIIIYAVFSSSRHLSVGPVATTSILVFLGASAYADPRSSDFISIAILLALMVGAIQFLLGIFRAGFIIKFIPHAVMNGYTSAAAIIIGISQFNHLLGINTETNLQVNILFVDIINNIKDTHLITVLIGIGSIFGLIVLKRINPRIPGALLILITSILTVYFFELNQSGLRIVGPVPKGLPSFNIPIITFQTIKMLVPIALTISLLGFMESSAIGNAIAKKEKYKIDANKELKALGLSNIIGAFFQSFPTNGSFSRTAVNYQSGGVTQITSVVTAVFVIITLQFFTSFFYFLPNASLAAIIIVSVYKLIDIKELKHLFRIKRFEGWVWLATFFNTLFIGIQWGIIMGVILTILWTIIRSAQPNIVEIGYLEKDGTFRDVNRFPEANTSSEVLMIRIDSALHFANISFLEEKIKAFLRKRKNTNWIVIDMSGVNDMDAQSIDWFEETIDHYSRQHGITILFTNMRGSVRDTICKVDWGKKYHDQNGYLIVEKLLKDKGIVPKIRLDYYI